MKSPPKLIKSKVSLQAVNGESLLVEGSANFTFDIGGSKINHVFHVVSDMNRNIILGRDFLQQQGVRVYFDLNCIRIGKVYVPLENDIHIASIVRVAKRTLLKPQSVNICIGKIKKHSCFLNSELLQVSAVDSGYINSEAGLLVSNSVTKIHKVNKIPVLMLNNTNKTICLNRGCVVGKVSDINTNDVSCVTKDGQTIESIDISNQKIDVPQDYLEVVRSLVNANEDIFADSDKDLGGTDTVKMFIDTGNHHPIKLKPYRTPIHKRPIVDKAIDEMLEANIIRRSRSPWSFPIVVVDKKDGSKRFCIDFRLLNRIRTRFGFYTQ
ncbi:unnamed protein product [Mytilus edulis]|uniref:Uncharacterized protein n=1 Tax=Mytilus edulis TaxID=6550 RepID=A0A8S3Q1T5_MYTED|nr:unnamed protein product [Mytilus edulis]